ncbi:MAG: thiosulfate oxidation carrier complex protein SoxZ [Thiotrichales bacterium]|jgi:sulfur-oxidizing protein SoxZ|nr:thiosulfate oxidation carrier complex protein SoxZ [Thiotrichales bacterium]MBT3612886.1 thiosulfate oxidation carrier complex protein SoxZ [Thiotrichales bacterium]MBT3752568.1 thiosulfate oxidation carrier complex protein SoxZ [Thiotrichales bacterium]MBT3838012.1 thiosulfate oxidation carrier complex protein SoxZ [Thiotrichales bacterium]MBT4152180.1 thiosulfate oxidation carrier complex protein SoxZ [Thiotrichales bacterium]
MAKAAVKLRAKEKNGVIDIKCLLNHPMETGLRKDKKSGNTIPAHFIQNIVAEKNGKAFLHADVNSTVSKNPYLRIQVEGGKGDEIKVTWTDSKGKSGSGAKKSK